MSTSRTLLDFASQDAVPAWEVVNDGVMGGVSSGAFGVGPDGTAVFAGRLRAENNGGFASVRFPLGPGAARGAVAFTLRVRGDGTRYRLTARMGHALDTPLYQHAFDTTPGAWETLRLPADGFVPTFRGQVLRGEPVLDPARVCWVGLLVADGQFGPFRLEVAWVGVG